MAVPVKQLAATVRDALRATDRYGGINQPALDALAELVARATEDIGSLMAEVTRLQQALEAGANYLRKLSDPMCPPAIRQVALDHFAELNDKALAGPGTPADSPPPMPEACPYCSCLTYRLVNNSLHMDAPDGAVICDNCGKGWVHSVDEHGLIPADSQEDEWFIPEGDRQCGVVHKMARATCMKRRGHDGSHATPQGTWIDGPWCEYPADSQEDKT